MRAPDYQRADLERLAAAHGGYLGADSERDPRLDPDPPAGRVRVVRPVRGFPARREDFDPDRGSR